MAIYKFSELTDGQTVVFDPNVDVLNFDDPNISATELSYQPNGINFVFNYSGGKAVTLSGLAATAVSPKNVTFADGSKVLIGDQTTGTSADIVGHVFQGSAGGDAIFAFDGVDDIEANAGNDRIYLAGFNNGISTVTSADVVDGGSGSDRVIFLAYNASGALTGSIANVSVDLNANGSGQQFAQWGTSSVTMRSIEEVHIVGAGGTVNTVVGSSGNESFAVGGRSLSNNATYTLDGGGGTDWLIFNFLNPTAINVSLADSSVTWGGGSAVAQINYSNMEGLSGTAGNDTLTGTDSADVVEYFRGHGGNDSIHGGLGFDYVTYTSAYSGATVDLLSGTASDGQAGTDSFDGIEGVIGTDYADSLTGNAENNVLNSGLGDDTFTGGTGNDTLDGGGGIDTAIYAGQFSNYSLSTTPDGFQVTDNVGTDGTDVLSNVEQLAFSDRTIQWLLPSKQGGTTYVGSDANDVVVAGGNNDKINLGSGDNMVDAGAGNNAVTTLGGDDSVTAGAGNDKISAGAGDNTINAGGGNNTVSSLEGGDSVTTGSGNDKISAGAGNNTINAGDGNNTVTVLDGDDNITTGNGNDKISAGDGNNTIIAGDGNNAISTGTGADSITCGDGKDKITAGSGDNTIMAGGGADSIVAGDGNDTVDAGAGNDKVVAGAGVDRIIGGQGADKLTGGQGSDTFVFSDIAEGGFDTISDFNDEDVLEISTSIFTQLVAATAFNFALGKAAADDNDYLIYDSAKGALYYDADASGAGLAVQIAVIKGSDAKTLAFDDLTFA